MHVHGPGQGLVTTGGSHSHTPPRSPLDAARRRALWAALGANAGYLVVELVVALVSGSLALFADSVHMVSDVAALAIALVANRLASAPASARHTYGLVRAEVIGGLVSAVLLLAVSVWIVIEAIGRFGDAPDVDGLAVVVVATLGFVVNAVSARWIARVSGASINLRAAFWHLAADALGSLAALVAGLALLAGVSWVDPAASLVIVALVVVSALALIRDALAVLLEAAPPGLQPAQIEAALASAPGVDAVHHVHVWSIGSETPALSAHVVLSGEPSLHEAQTRGDALKLLLVERFGIAHATLELECHDCDTGHVTPPELPQRS